MGLSVLPSLFYKFLSALKHFTPEIELVYRFTIIETILKRSYNLYFKLVLKSFSCMSQVCVENTEIANYFKFSFMHVRKNETKNLSKNKDK